MLVILAVQTFVMSTYAYFVTYRLMGKDYDAAVLAGGHCGFGLGATPTAVANMQSITEKFGPSHKAFLIVPMVGAFFVDFVNAFILTGFFYISVDDFFNDDATIEGGGGIGEEKPKNITKELIDVLPSILKVVMDTLASLSNLPVSRVSTEISNFNCNEDEFCMGSVAFYGEMNAKFILCLDKYAVRKICKILLQQDESVSITEA